MATATTETTAQPTRRSARVRVQMFGTFLSNMIMPNIGAIIAWGLITAFFIDVGWTPNERIAAMVGPTILYLLPILIAYTGGKIVYDIRGGVVGATSVMGVIIATSDPLFIGDGNASPMFLGAMIMGPLTAYVMKRLDASWEGKIKPGFEMLVNNFSAGITAAVLAVASMFTLAPVLRQVIDWLGSGVEALVNNNLLPLTSIFIEPAKVMFLNNAINHGVLTPLGIDQAAETGQSVLFLLEANPGPGLGLLLAYTFFGRGVAKASAPGAAIIQFFGGIHEVYFPYVLMKPKLLLAMIAGGMTGVALLVAFGVGLRAPAAPGSIMAVYAQTPGGNFLGVTVGVFGAALVTFLVAAAMLRFDRGSDDLAAATAEMEAMKGKKSIASTFVDEAHEGPIHDIVFACDAGMGSSAMGASVLRKKIKEAGLGDVKVTNIAIANLRDEHDLIVTHQDLTGRAQHHTPSAIHVSVENFMASPRYDEVVELIKDRNTGGGKTSRTVPAQHGAPEEESGSGATMSTDMVVLGGSARTKEEAITEAGRLLVDSGAVDPAYVDAMHERERSVSTHMGNLLAIPHGTNDAKASIHRTAISLVRYDEPIDWSGKPAKFVIGIAGVGDEHLTMLGQIARVFVDQDRVAQLEAAGTKEEVIRLLGVGSTPAHT